MNHLVFPHQLEKEKKKKELHYTNKIKNSPLSHFVKPEVILKEVNLDEFTKKPCEAA